MREFQDLKIAVAGTGYVGLSRMIILRNIWQATRWILPPAWMQKAHIMMRILL